MMIYGGGGKDERLYCLAVHLKLVFDPQAQCWVPHAAESG